MKSSTEASSRNIEASIWWDRIAMSVVSGSKGCTSRVRTYQRTADLPEHRATDLRVFPNGQGTFIAIRSIADCGKTAGRSDGGLDAIGKTVSGHARTGRRLFAVILCAGTVGLAVRYAADPPVPGVFGGPTAPPGLTGLLSALFSDASCHVPSASAAAVRNRLATIGLSDWSVRIRPEVNESDCVAATYDTAERAVVLTLAMRPEIKHAIAAVVDQLLAQCLTRDQAESVLRDALAGAGATDFEVRTGGGEAGPIDREAEIHAHFEAGCWIYSGSGWREDGTPIYVLGGK